MANEETGDKTEIANEAGQESAAGKRQTTSRRRVLGMAAVGGLGAAMYVKPNLREIGVPGTYAQVSPGLGTDPPPSPDVDTRTLGYWQTHGGSTYQSEPPYNGTWDNFRTSPYNGTPDNNFLPFYHSGKNYMEQFWTSAGGNAYNMLAVQFIAAQLNILAGAPPPTGVSMTDIEAFFSNPANTPSYIGTLKGNSPLRQQLLAWASVLDTYNNG